MEDVKYLFPAISEIYNKAHREDLHARGLWGRDFPSLIGLVIGAIEGITQTLHVKHKTKSQDLDEFRLPFYGFSIFSNATLRGWREDILPII